MEMTVPDRIGRLLIRLGITANYKGYFHTACALRLAVQNPELLLQLTKRLYPEVAKQCGTSAPCVERNIRAAAGLAWMHNPALLEALARRPLTGRPTASQFLAVLTAYIRAASPAC